MPTSSQPSSPVPAQAVLVGEWALLLHSSAGLEPDAAARLRDVADAMLGQLAAALTTAMNICAPSQALLLTMSWLPECAGDDE